MVIPFDPERVLMKLCAFSFSKEELRLLRTMVLAAGKMRRFSLVLELSRKREFLIYP